MLNLEAIKKVLSQHGYEYTGFLGEGSFSSVFLCKSKKLSHTFAIKRATTQQVTLLEYNNLMSLNHPNIIKLYDAFNDDDDSCQYLVMEYCSNGTIFQKGRLTYDKFVYYAKQILEALAFCHSNNIVHRDIKPENILLDQFDRIKLADFGLSKQFDISDESYRKISSLMLLPPEMFQNGNVDYFKADIYALGITFFYMATGSYPHQRIQINDIKKNLMSQDFFSPRYNMHPKIKKLIDMMIDKNSNEHISAEKLLELPIFSSRLSRKSVTLYNSPAFITQTNLNLNSSSLLNLKQSPTQPGDLLAYKSPSNHRIAKTSRHVQPPQTFLVKNE